jgi:hypothetical protein
MYYGLVRGAAVKGALWIGDVARLTSMTFLDGMRGHVCSLGSTVLTPAATISVTQFPGDPGENQIKRYGAEHARLRRCKLSVKLSGAQGAWDVVEQFGRNLAQQERHNMTGLLVLGSLGLAIGHITALRLCKIQEDRIRIGLHPSLIKTCKNNGIKPNNRTFDFQPGVFADFSWYCATDVLVEEDVDAVREIVRMVSEAGGIPVWGGADAEESAEYTHMMSSLFPTSLEDAYSGDRGGERVSMSNVQPEMFDVNYVLEDTMSNVQPEMFDDIVEDEEVWMRDAYRPMVTAGGTGRPSTSVVWTAITAIFITAACTIAGAR